MFGRLIHLLITGTVETGENSAKILAQDIVTLESIRQNAINAIELTLDYGNISRELLEHLLDIVFRYPGESGLIFNVSMPDDKKVKISAHDRFKVLPSHKLIAEIEALIGKKVQLL